MENCNREDFEKWKKEHSMNLEITIRDSNGDYQYIETRRDWYVWQNAIATRQPEIDALKAELMHMKSESEHAVLVDEIERLKAAPSVQASSFQNRVQPWMMACFGPVIASDKEERNHRFLEEALELVQACGCTQNESHKLVDYVYGRTTGEKVQEVGGVMVTLAALCLAHGVDMHEAGETELARIWTKVEQIRAKQAAKPKHSPLPVTPPAQDEPVAYLAVRRTGTATEQALLRPTDDVESYKYRGFSLRPLVHLTDNKLRKAAEEVVSYFDGDKEPDFPYFIALIENLRAAVEGE